MIDTATVDRIYAAADIAEVVQDYVSLKKRGANYLGLCPFHSEKTPSFTVSASKGIYKCFGCGKGGNAVNFIMEAEHLSYYEALRHLAKKYHIEVHEREQTEEDLRQQNERESLLIVSEQAGKYFRDVLHNYPEGQAVGISYFRERGIREDMIERFQLGYSPERRDAFTSYAVKAGYKLEYLIKTGLTIQHEGGNPFDRFAGRVMFPIHSLSGKVIGFGGRILRTDKNTAKYLNSPESDIYHKSQVLYGLFHARKAIEKSGKCYMVEGYTDVISMHQAGVENVVASSGTSLTVEQIRLIKRFTNHLTMLYDGDAAGIKASLRGIDLVLEEGLNVKVLLLPDGEDPDSYSKKVSNQELMEFIGKNESDFITFKTRLLLGDAKNDPIKMAGLINDVVRSIASIPDQITRSVYIRECSNILQTDERALYSQVDKIRRERSYQKTYKEAGIPLPPQDVTVVPQPPLVVDEESPKEEAVIRLLLNFGHYDLFNLKDQETGEERTVSVAEFLVNEIRNDELEFSHPVYRKLFAEFEQLFLTGEGVHPQVFTQSTDPEISRLAATLLAPMPEESAIWRKNGIFIQTEEEQLPVLVPKTLIAFQGQRILNALKETQEQLKSAQAAGKDEEMRILQIRIMELNKTKVEFAKNLGERIVVR
ncbi:MAG: DNA primase [Bacteroidales bacterium]